MKIVHQISEKTKVTQIGIHTFLVQWPTEEKHPWEQDNYAFQYATGGDSWFVCDAGIEPLTVFELSELPKLEDGDYYDIQRLGGTRYSFRFLILPASYFIN